MQEPTAFPPLIQGAEFDLVIEKAAFGGKALGRVNGLVVFVDHAVPGQKVRVQVTRTKKQFAEARVVRLLTQSPAYAPPFCPHFGLCGGCQWQDFAYEEQLRWKRLHVQESLQHLAGLQPGMVLSTVPSPETRYYRNKMEFTFAPRPWQPNKHPAAGKDSPKGGLALGLHVRFSSEGIFNLEHCFLQSPQTPAIVREVRRWLSAGGLPAYNTRNHRGFWRFLVLREGKRTARTLVQIITTDQGGPQAVEALAAHLQAQFPGITTMVHSLSRKKAQIAGGEASRTLWGPGYIEEQLGGLRLRVSAHSFLQTNTGAAAGLYDAIGRLGEFTGRETVWDLYCGAGSIGLFLASRVRQVVGFELVAEAVADAYTNSRLNGISNCRFLAGDVKERMREILRTGSQPLPEVVITDPPRAGLHPQVTQALRELSPRRIIYVSCNPATLARDLALLKDDYEVLTVQPFDLFPHTSHIECVVRLERRNQERKKGLRPKSATP
jgi:23S rRNA (uracil1939-C5)-methyltransferase